jgi:uroporphyrinogen-III synthase
VARLRPDLLSGIDVVLSPLLEIVPTGATPDTSLYGGVIFTSANAVRLAPTVKGQMALCVGSITAHHAQAAGWNVVAIEQTAEDLIARIAKIKPAGPLLHLAGRHRRGDIAERLNAVNIKVDVETLYDQTPVVLTKQAHAVLEGEGLVVVPLFSPRTAAHFIDQTPNLHNVTVVAMSEAVAECCKGTRVARILVAAMPTGQEMCRTVEKVLSSTSLP